MLSALKSRQFTRTTDNFPRHHLATAFRTEYLATEAAMMLPPERGEFQRTIVALLRLGIGHPELMQLSIFVARQIILREKSLDCEHFR